MKKQVTKESVVKLLVKRGFNENDAIARTDKEFDTVTSVYPDATAGQIAECVMMA